MILLSKYGYITPLMPRLIIKEVVRKVPLDELNEWVRVREKEVRVLKRLYFIRHLYNGDTVKEVAERIGMTTPRGTHGLNHGMYRDTKASFQISEGTQAEDDW